MGISRRFKCDCGCGRKAVNYKVAGWFVLSQLKRKGRNDDPKLSRNVYLATLDCVKCWSSLAVQDLPELQKAGRGLHPRGTFASEVAPGLYV